jgi:hypothetical protein
MPVEEPAVFAGINDIKEITVEESAMLMGINNINVIDELSFEVLVILMV